MPQPLSSPSDEWMTTGEIAEELRITPATVRLWISKGDLPATRAGMRKLLVRRSDLAAMLAAWSRAERAAAEDQEPQHPETSDPGTSAAAFESATKLLAYANETLNAALHASALARPSDGYTDRLRAIADGFEHVASTAIHASKTAGAEWKGMSGYGPERLPYELRPGGNRPEREGLWSAFDDAIRGLGVAMAERELLAVGEAFRRCCDELLKVAGRIDEMGTAKRSSSAV